MGSNDLEEELWNIYTHYTLHGNPRDPSKLTGNVLLKICRDILILESAMTERSITQAEVELIFSSQLAEMKRNKVVSEKENKLEYDDFLSCLVRIACHCYPSGKTPEDSMQQLIMDNLIPYASKRRVIDIASVLKQHEIEKQFKYYEDSLLEIFRAYASAADHNSKRNLLLKSTMKVSHTKATFDSLNNEEKNKSTSPLKNSLANHIGYQDFIRFAGDYGLSSMGLTILDLGDIYLSVISAKNFDTSVRKLTFKEFWEILVRCALFSFRDITYINEEDKVKGMFLHIWRHVQTTVKAQIKGTSTQSSYKGGLIRGSQMLNERFITSWIKDGYCDYLAPAKEKSVYRDENATNSVLSKIIEQSTDIQSIFNINAPNLLSDIPILDNDEFVDPRITPQQLKLLLKQKPEIVGILQKLIKELD